MRSATGFALGALCPNHNKFVCKPLESLVLGTFRACSISKIDFCTVRTLNLHWCLLNLKLPRYLCMYVHPSNNSLSFIRIRRKCLFFLNKKKKLIFNKVTFKNLNMFLKNIYNMEKILILNIF